MTLAQIQAYRSMDQNTESRNKPMPIWSIIVKIFNGKMLISLISAVDKTSHMQNDETTPYT